MFKVVTETKELDEIVKHEQSFIVKESAETEFKLHCLKQTVDFVCLISEQNEIINYAIFRGHRIAQMDLFLNVPVV